MIKYKTDHLVIFESSLYRTNSVLVIGDFRTMLVDPNWLPIEISEIQQHFLAHRVEKKSFCVFTHADYDHVIAWKAFDVDVTIASHRISNEYRKSTVLEEIHAFDESHYIQRDYPIGYPVPDVSVEGKIAIDFGNENVVFTCCEGHSPDDMMIFFEQRGLWIVGDYLSNIELPIIDYDIKSYYKSLLLFEELINDAKPAMMIPGHGDCTGDVGEMHRRLDSSYEYLEALKSGDETRVEKLINSYPFKAEQLKIHKRNLIKMTMT